MLLDKYIKSTLFLLPRLFCNVEFEFSWFRNTNSHERFFNSQNMLLKFQNKTNIEIIGF